MRVAREVYVNMKISKNEVTPWEKTPTGYTSYPVCHSTEVGAFSKNEVLFREVIEPSSELGDVEEMAKDYAEGCDNESGSFLSRDLIKIRVKSFKAGHASRQPEIDQLLKLDHDKNVLFNKKCDELQSQLDEVTKVKERYRKALEFYADRNSWKFYSYKNDRKDTIEFSDLGCKSYSSEADYSCSSGGRRAREALNGV